MSELLFAVNGDVINPATKLVIPAAAERRAGIQIYSQMKTRSL